MHVTQERTANLYTYELALHCHLQGEDIDCMLLEYMQFTYALPYVFHAICMPTALSIDHAVDGRLGTFIHTVAVFY